MSIGPYIFVSPPRVVILLATGSDEFCEESSSVDFFLSGLFLSFETVMATELNEAFDVARGTVPKDILKAAGSNDCFTS